MASRVVQRKTKDSLYVTSKGASSTGSSAFRRSVIDYVLGPDEGTSSSSSGRGGMDTEVAPKCVFWHQQNKNNAHIVAERTTNAAAAQDTIVSLSDGSEDVFSWVEPLGSSDDDRSEGYTEMRLQACHPVAPEQTKEDSRRDATVEHANTIVQSIILSSRSSKTLKKHRSKKGKGNSGKPGKAARMVFSPCRRKRNTSTRSACTSVEARQLACRDDNTRSRTTSRTSKMAKYVARPKRRNTQFSSCGKKHTKLSAPQLIVSCSNSSNEGDTETEGASLSTSDVILPRRRTNNAHDRMRPEDSASQIESDIKNGNTTTKAIFLRRMENDMRVQNVAGERKEKDGTRVASRKTKMRCLARRKINCTTCDLTDTTTAQEHTSWSRGRIDAGVRAQIPARKGSSSSDEKENAVASQGIRMRFLPRQREISTTRRTTTRKSGCCGGGAQDAISNPSSNDLETEATIVENRPTLPSFARITAQTWTKPKADCIVSVSTCSRQESVLTVGTAISRLGWKEKLPMCLDASIVWLGVHVSPENLTPYQIYSKIEGFDLLCKKSATASLVNLMQDAFPHLFQFMPKTWILRRDKHDQALALQQTMKETKGETFICKPSGGSFGRGIRLVKKWADLKRIINKVWPVEGSKKHHRGKRPEYVIQRYISKPLLVDGYKFDLRVYVVVTSIVPLTAYIFHEGHGRFCTHQYKMPQKENLKDPFMHVTNCNVNARSGKFQSSRAHDRGSKRSLSSILEWIEQHNGPNVSTMFESIKELCERTLLALLPGLILQYSTQRPTVGLHPHGPKGFQLIGFDILVEENHRVRLIEVNSNPAMSCMLPKPDPTSQHNVQMPKHNGKRRKMEVSAVDFAVKVELIAQAMLISNPLSHQETMARKHEFLKRTGRVTCGAAFSEPIPSLDQRRAADPPRRADNPQAAPALQPLDFSREAYEPVREAIDAYVGLYRVFRGFTGASSLLFNQCAFRTACEQHKFFSDKGSARFFKDVVEADAFFAQALHQAQKDAGLTKEVTELLYPQFLLYICVPLGKKLDPRCELRALMAIRARLCPVTEDSAMTRRAEDASGGSSQHVSVSASTTTRQQYGPSTIWDATPPASDDDAGSCAE